MPAERHSRQPKSAAATPRKRADVLARRATWRGGSLLAGARAEVIGPWAIDCMAMHAPVHELDRSAIDDFSPGTLMLSIFGLVLAPVMCWA